MSDFFKGYSFKMRLGKNPSFPEDARLVIEEAAALRGWAIRSFAQVEFMLAFLVQKAAAKWPETYGEFAATIPFRPEGRPKRLRQLLAVEGPLRAHATEIEEIMSDLASFEEFRHLIVHGWSDVVRARNGLFLRWRLYKPKPGNAWAMTISTTRIETLREQRAQLVAFSSSAVSYFGSLSLHYGLEEPGPDAAFADADD